MTKTNHLRGLVVLAAVALAAALAALLIVSAPAWGQVPGECTTCPPPLEIFTTPEDGDTGVYRDTNVQVYFVERSMDPTTINTTTFTLVKQGTTTPLEATVTYAYLPESGNLPGASSATLDPQADLEANTTYTATLKGGDTGVREASGVPLLTEDMVWSFTTGDSTTPPPPPDTLPPTVVSVSPAAGATGVDRDKNIRATFSEALDPTTIDDSTVTLVNRDTGQKVDGVVSYDASTNKVTLDPSARLAKYTRYRVRIEGAGDTDNLAVKDLADNALASDYTWTFKTGSS